MPRGHVAEEREFFLRQTDRVSLIPTPAIGICWQPDYTLR